MFALVSLVVAAALTIDNSPAAFRLPTPPPTVSLEAIRMLVCQTPEGRYKIGTAFVIDKDIMVTAHHVENGRVCVDSATRRVVTTYHQDVDHDFSLVTMNTDEIIPIRYSCEPFTTGRYYSSYGYGESTFRQNRLEATARTSGLNFWVQDRVYAGMRLLKGVLTPGMSGGPMIDEATGLAHGLNNVTNTQTEAWSFQLSDTILCREPRPTSE